MDTKQKGKLERYVRNANHFIWGLGPRNQKVTYEWLNVHGFNDNGAMFKGSYSNTTEKLIKSYGIEKIMRDIVGRRIKELFPTPFVDFMRNCWKAGVRPTVDMLKANGFGGMLDNRDMEIFLLYNRQFNFIGGWGELTGIWFEEIEDLLK